MSRESRIRFIATTRLGIEASAHLGFHFLVRLGIVDGDCERLAFFRLVGRIVLFRLLAGHNRHRLLDSDIHVLRILHDDDNRIGSLVAGLVAVEAHDGIRALLQGLRNEGILHFAIHGPLHVDKVRVHHLAIGRREYFHDRRHLVDHDEQGAGRRVAVLVRVGVAHFVAEVAVFVLHEITLGIDAVSDRHDIAIVIHIVVGDRKDDRILGLAILRILAFLVTLSRFLAAFLGVLAGFLLGVAAVSLDDLTRHGIGQVRDANLATTNLCRIGDRHRLDSVRSLDDIAFGIRVVGDRHVLAVDLIRVGHGSRIAVHRRVGSIGRMFVQSHTGIHQSTERILERVGRNVDRLEFDLHREGFARMGNGIRHRHEDVVLRFVHVERGILGGSLFHDSEDVRLPAIIHRLRHRHDRSRRAEVDNQRIDAREVLRRILELADNDVFAFMELEVAIRSLELAVGLPFDADIRSIHVERIGVDDDRIAGLGARDFHFGAFDHVADLDGHRRRIPELAIEHLDNEGVFVLRFVIERIDQRHDTRRGVDLEHRRIATDNRVDEFAVLGIVIRIGSLNRIDRRSDRRIFANRNGLVVNLRSFVHVRNLHDNRLGLGSILRVGHLHRDRQFMILLVIQFGAVVLLHGDNAALGDIEASALVLDQREGQHGIVEVKILGLDSINNGSLLHILFDNHGVRDDPRILIEVEERDMDRVGLDKFRHQRIHQRDVDGVFRRIGLEVERLVRDQVAIGQQREQRIGTVSTARQLELVVDVVFRLADSRNGHRIDIFAVFHMAYDNAGLVVFLEFERPGFEGRRFVDVNNFNLADEGIGHAARVGHDNGYLVNRIDGLVVKLRAIQDRHYNPILVVVPLLDSNGKQGVRTGILVVNHARGEVRDLAHVLVGNNIGKHDGTRGAILLDANGQGAVAMRINTAASRVAISDAEAIGIILTIGAVVDNNLRAFIDFVQVDGDKRRIAELAIRNFDLELEHRGRFVVQLFAVRNLDDVRIQLERNRIGTENRVGQLTECRILGIRIGSHKCANRRFVREVLVDSLVERFQGRCFVHVDDPDNAYNRIGKIVRIRHDDKHTMILVDLFKVKLGTIRHIYVNLPCGIDLRQADTKERVRPGLVESNQGGRQLADFTVVFIRNRVGNHGRTRSAIFLDAHSQRITRIDATSGRIAMGHAEAIGIIFTVGAVIDNNLRIFINIVERDGNESGIGKGLVRHAHLHVDNRSFFVIERCIFRNRNLTGTVNVEQRVGTGCRTGGRIEQRVIKRTEVRVELIRIAGLDNAHGVSLLGVLVDSERSVLDIRFLVHVGHVNLLLESDLVAALDTVLVFQGQRHGKCSITIRFLDRFEVRRRDDTDYREGRVVPLFDLDVEQAFSQNRVLRIVVRDGNHQRRSKVRIGSVHVLDFVAGNFRSRCGIFSDRVVRLAVVNELRRFVHIADLDSDKGGIRKVFESTRCAVIGHDNPHLVLVTTFII